MFDNLVVFFAALLVAEQQIATPTKDLLRARNCDGIVVRAWQHRGIRRSIARSTL
jgi:hypothetical protein